MEQTVSFTIESAADIELLQQDLDRYLPMDIRILSCETAPERFRADLNARSRTYEYRICTRHVYDIFSSAYTAHIFPAPDIPVMEAAALHLKGRHDFRSFSGARKKKGTIKEVTDISFRKSDTEEDLLIISITADDFLYRMPSLIIGTLLETGQGRRSQESILSILKGTEKAGAPCDAKGLLLKSVQY